MTEVKVLFTKQNYAGFLYAINKEITEHIYQNGKLVEVNYVKPKREYYSVVDQLSFDKEMSNRSIFSKIKKYYKHEKKVAEIAQKAEEGTLNISHYEFSAGDMVKIDSDYFISDGLRMQGIDL